MTKQIILIFAVLCSVQVQANSRYTERDTVQHEFFHDATELFQPLQPVYFDGVVVPRTGSGNWFVSVTGGTTALRSDGGDFPLYVAQREAGRT